MKMPSRAFWFMEFRCDVCGKLFKPAESNYFNYCCEQCFQNYLKSLVIEGKI